MFGLRTKRVTSKEALEQLASLYERQGLEVMRPNPRRIEAYNRKTGKLVKIAECS